MQKTFLSAEWRKLIIANYAVDPGLLIPRLPYKTELDIWKGKCYVSLVAFRFMNTRLMVIPVPFHKDFEEINLRFYVLFKDGNNWKRGVVFIKEIVPKYAISFVANTIYNEKYATLPMNHSWFADDISTRISYGCKHKGLWDTIGVEAGSNLMDIQQGSEEEFITEHYWGYTRFNDLKTSQYQVDHPRWQTYPVLNFAINLRFADLYGPEFSILNNAAPGSIMLAEGSKITVQTATDIN